MAKFDKLFTKPADDADQVSVSFMLPAPYASRVNWFAKKLGTTQSAVYRSLVAEALPLLEAEMQRRSEQS